MRYVALFLVAWGFSASASSTASVSRQMFQVGHQWEWLYSEWNKSAQTWTPYYLERYTVTAVVGDAMTIEMSSAPAGEKIGSAHHKFIVDFRKCERAARDAAFKRFPVTLYTKSFGPDWELVSSSHGNLIFTEKFNCAGTLPGQKVDHSKHQYNYDLQDTFRIANPVHRGSWYFLNLRGLEGVAATKLFSQGAYKFEFIGQRLAQPLSGL